jgi:UDP-N-acetylglucosamine--N-acetylmuramyl-(pentapeptide) pyrophosphoryl-undecaprenol N-acetylglucosamine transferase
MTKILMTGGGTLGPVTPLLAMVQAWREQDPEVQFLWMGTPQGPERVLVEQLQVPFFSMRSAKLDRHRPWKWPLIPFLLLWSLVRAFLFLRKEQPDLIVSAGGYVSVPVVIVGWGLRIKRWVHQLDVTPGLANRLMAPFASRVSVTWPSSAEQFAEKKTMVLGGVVRPEIFQADKERVMTRYGLDSEKPVLLVMGGGTGSVSINNAMEVIGRELLETMSIIHVTGKGKLTQRLEAMPEAYVVLEFVAQGMLDLMAAADLVVSRAGMASVLELSALKKPTVLVPLHNTDQLDNARLLEKGDAAEVLYEVNPQILLQTIQHLMNDAQRRHRFAQKIGRLVAPNGAGRFVQEAQRLIVSKG